MHDVKTIEDRDLKECLRDCQQRQYPFIFWDKEEVENFNLSSLPLLTKAPPLPWEATCGNTIAVDLDNPDSIAAFKEEAIERIKDREDTTIEVGFALVLIEGSVIQIQTYHK